MNPCRLMGVFRFKGNMLEAEICFKMVRAQLTLEEQAMVLTYLGLPVPEELNRKLKGKGLLVLIKATETGLSKLASCY